MIPLALLPAPVLLKDRPLERGHRLYAVTFTKRRKKNDSCAVWCSCGIRLVCGSAARFQEALDLAARNHRREVA